MSEQLIIIGASARAAAESAVGSGMRVHAFDLFCDDDLSRIACAIQICGNDYPANIPKLLRALPADIPWMYTGGIENHSALIEELSAVRPLLGNPCDVVNTTRGGRWLADVARSAGWRFPSCNDAQGSHEFICKPRRHCGGLGIRRLSDGDQPDPQRYFVQPFVAGPTFSAVFVGDGNGHAHLLGVTRQSRASDFEQHPLGKTHPFAYVGSTGPITVTTYDPWNADDVASWIALSKAIAAATPIRGIFGVDAIKNDELGWTLLELNPRWTSSVEVLERTLGFNVFDVHRNGCFGDLPAALAEQPSNAPLIAKTVHYAAEDVQVTAEWKRALRASAAAVESTLHDIPATGSLIKQGHPTHTEMTHKADRHDEASKK